MMQNMTEAQATRAVLKLIAELRPLKVSKDGRIMIPADASEELAKRNGAFNRKDEAGARLQVRWSNEVDGGADDMAALGELEMVKGIKDLEERLRLAEERFERVKPLPRTPDQLMPTTASR